MNNMGWANQSMSTRPEVARSRLFFTAFSYGNTSWTCPTTGYYTFTARGPGGTPGAGTGGGSGGATQITVLLFRGQVVNFTIGRPRRFAGAGTETSTIVTFPSGVVMTAGVALGALAGPASGGDLNVPGNPGAGNLGGASPDIGAFLGSPSSPSSEDLSPGVGVGASTSGATTRSDAGPGILYVQAGKV